MKRGKGDHSPSFTSLPRSSIHCWYAAVCELYQSYISMEAQVFSHVVWEYKCIQYRCTVPNLLCKGKCYWFYVCGSAVNIILNKMICLL